MKTKYVFILFFSLNVFTECYEEDRKWDEVDIFNIENYKIEIGSTYIGVSKECNDNVDFFRVYDGEGNLVFDKPWIGYDDKHDYNPILIENYKSEILEEPYLVEIVKKLKTLEGENWKYYIAMQWAGSCGGCLQLHKISLTDGFKYHGRIYLQPATYATLNTASLRKKDLNGVLLYDIELE